MNSRASNGRSKSVSAAGCWLECLGVLVFTLHADAASPTTATTAPAPGDVYACLADGRKSDREMTDCAGLQTRTSRAGVVTLILTSEQRRRVDECDARLAELILEWRKDERSRANLRAKYPDLASLRLARDGELASARAAVERSRVRLVDLDKERKRLALDREFYPKGPVPADLQRRIDQNDAVIAAQEQVSKKAQEDVTRITANLDELERTMKKLWVASAAPMPTMDCSAETLFLRSQTRIPSKRR